MKILFIDHVEPDFLAAVVYMGLRQEFGHQESVVDWPWKASYHGQNYEGPIPYDPPNDRGVTSPFPWMPAHDGRAWSDDEVTSRIGEFDLVLLASPRAYNVAALGRLVDRVGRRAIRKLALMDGEDYTAVRWDMVERFRPEMYFKLSMVSKPYEVYHDAKARMAGSVRLLPLPLASPHAGIAPAPKDIDVVFFGGTNWRPNRQEGVAAGPPQNGVLLERLRGEFPSFQGGHLGFEQYMATLSRAKIAVCVGGSGLEPMRTYEILSCPGTLLARERIDVISPYPFVAGVDHVGWTNADELCAVLRQYLADEPARAQIAETGNRFLRDFHTPKARAQYLIREALA
jgi:hypothetical protein